MPSHDSESTEQLKQATKWQPPSMQTSASQVFSNRIEDARVGHAKSRMPTADELEQWRRDAEAEGYAQGMEAAREEIAAHKQRFLQLVDFLQQPLTAINEEVEQQLSLVAVTLAQHLVRREIRVEPGEIIGLIRDSVKLLPANTRKVSILLNPEDAALVRTALSIGATDDEQSWTLVDDPMITRGGCEIKSEASMINVTLEHRLAALAASVLGGEREQD